MTFLNPLLLLGILGIAAPILIHLLNRHRHRRQVWAAMRFLRLSIERNRRRLRVEDLILLLLRCGIIAFIALALARPVLDWLAPGWLGGSATTAVILVDASGSMSGGGGERADRARETARRIVEDLPPGAKVAVFSVSERPIPLVSEPTSDTAFVSRRIAELRNTDGAANWSAGVTRANDILKRENSPQKEVILISDDYEGISAVRAQTEQAASVDEDLPAMHLVKLEDALRNKLGLTSAQVQSPFAAVSEPLTIEAAVANLGTEAVQAVPVKLMNRAGEVLDQKTIAEIPPGGTSRATLHWIPTEAGVATLNVVLAGDDMPFDDARPIALRVLDHVDVLLVDGEPGTKPVESETFFLRYALAPVDPARQQEHFIQLEVVDHFQLDPSLLEGRDVVVLANVPELPLNVPEALESYVRGGGGLMVFLGDQVNEAAYNQHLFENRRLLPSRLTRSENESGDEPSQMLRPEVLPHPVAEALQEVGLAELSEYDFRGWFDLEPPAGGDETDGDTATVLAFNAGKPALMTHKVGQGEVFLFASSADAEWNNLPLGPYYLPLVQRALAHLLQNREERLTLKAGTPFMWPVSAKDTEAQAVVYPLLDTTGGGTMASFDDSGTGQTMAVYHGTANAGLYELVPVNSPRIQFAVQPSEEETLRTRASALSAPDPGPVNLIPVLAGQFPDARLFNRGGAEFWTLLLAIALILSVIELFLGQRFSRPH